MKKVNQRKALYSKTTTTGTDGTIQVEVVQLDKQIIVKRESYKGNEPVGKWIVNTYGTNTKELDYDFDLVYATNLCEKDSGSYISFKKLPALSPFISNDSLGYLAPKLSTGERNLNFFVQKHIAYNPKAIEHNISGTVLVQFIIGLDGSIEGMAIRKGVNVLIDKEAMRLIRKLKFNNGAVLGGVAKKICAIQPITFKIDE